MRCEELQDTICLFPCIWSDACHALLCTGSPLAQPRYIKMTPSLNALVKPPAQTPTLPVQAGSNHSRISATVQGLRRCTIHHGRPHTKRCSNQAGVERGKGLHPPGPGRVSSTGGLTGRSPLHRTRRAVLPSATEA